VGALAFATYSDEELVVLRDFMTSGREFRARHLERIKPGEGRKVHQSDERWVDPTYPGL
jgi:hypothetical protein